MSNSNTTASSGGVSFCGLLALIFITLKLLNKIDWSWWWVLSPVWIPVGLVLLVLLVAFLLVGHKPSIPSKPQRGRFTR